MAFRSTARLLHSHATPASLASASFKSLPKKVRIVEVGLRDGLQNEKQPIPLQTKIALLDKLYDAGLRTIEAGAFVSPKWVPQMGDTPQLFAYLREERAKGRYRGATFTALAPNAKGFEAAHSLGVEEVAIFGAVSESFTRKNSNASIEESYGRMEEIATLARRHNVRMRGYISCVMGCPYEGPVDPSAVVTAAKRLLDMGCYEISLGDTIGTGTAGATHRLLESLWSAGLPVEKFAAHFHDTYGQALSNVLVALQHGIAVVDSSVSGLGGCPYAKGASGNLSTNDLLYLLDNSGLHTGVNSGKLLQAALFIDGQLGRNSESRVVKALKAKQEKQEAKK